MFLCFWLFALPRLLISRFSFVKQPPSVEKRKGFFFPPKHSHEKFFRKFFHNYPSDFLLIFWREKLWRVAASCKLPQGGVPLFCGLVGFSLPLFLSFLTCSGSFFRSFRPCGLPGLIVQHWEHLGASGRLWTIGSTPNSSKGAQKGLKRGKNKEFFEVRWCFLGVLRYLEGAKPKIFLN